MLKQLNNNVCGYQADKFKLWSLGYLANMLVQDEEFLQSQHLKVNNWASLGTLLFTNLQTEFDCIKSHN